MRGVCLSIGLSLLAATGVAAKGINLPTSDNATPQSCAAEAMLAALVLSQMPHLKGIQTQITEAMISFGYAAADDAQCAVSEADFYTEVVQGAQARHADMQASIDAGTAASQAMALGLAGVATCQTALGKDRLEALMASPPCGWSRTVRLDP